MQRKGRALQPRIALDGPSALVFYRDRDERTSQTGTLRAETPVEFDADGDVWLSDEDVAATLSEVSVFGRTTKFAPNTQNTPSELPVLKRSQMQRLGRCASTSWELKQIPYESLGIQPRSSASPLYILVSDPDDRRRVTQVNQRAFTFRFPKYSFLRLDTTAIVPSPELLFVLMAHYLTLTGLMLLAMELCGHYRLVGASSSKHSTPSERSTTSSP